jgi:hypothetical protein
MTPEVGKEYITTAASGNGHTAVTVREVWEQAGSLWVKVDGQFTSGSEEGVTLPAGMLYTPEEWRAKHAPKPFTAKFGGTCARCKTAITPGQQVSYLHGTDVRATRNPVVHVECPSPSTARVRMATMHSDGSRVDYSARIIRREEDGTWVEIPERVRALPFPPYQGKRYVKLRNAYVDANLKEVSQ